LRCGSRELWSRPRHLRRRCPDHWGWTCRRCGPGCRRRARCGWASLLGRLRGCTVDGRGQHGQGHCCRCETGTQAKHCLLSSHDAAIETRRRLFWFHRGSIRLLYVEFAFRMFIRRSFDDDALPQGSFLPGARPIDTAL
jgi:hypothetical protein